MKESDLYLPVKRFLESQNYEVKGEVKDCDALAARGKEAPVVVELKLSSRGQAEDANCGSERELDDPGRRCRSQVHCNFCRSPRANSVLQVAASE